MPTVSLVYLLTKKKASIEEGWSIQSKLILHITLGMNATNV